MLYTIDNGTLKVTVSARGAELQSVIRGGHEYLWQGDPAVWKDRAPNLFPFVGRLVDKTYVLDGQERHMEIHGFAKLSEFELAERTENSLVFALRDNEETYAVYPRHFVFRVEYRLDGGSLLITFRVNNTDGRVLDFGLGAHPGFNVPMEEGLAFEDYRIAIPAGTPLSVVRMTETCFVSGEEAPFDLADENNGFALRHDLFDHDAVILRNPSGSVRLYSPKGTRSVEVYTPQMDYVGFWHRVKAEVPYVCIEPWCSLPAHMNGKTDFANDPGLYHLAPGCEYVNNWSVKFE